MVVVYNILLVDLSHIFYCLPQALTRVWFDVTIITLILSSYSVIAVMLGMIGGCAW